MLLQRDPTMLAAIRLLSAEVVGRLFRMVQGERVAEQEARRKHLRVTP
jgi:hypothetical protein